MANATYELALESIVNLQGKSLEIALATVTPVKALSGNMEWTEVGGGIGYSRQPITLTNGVIELGQGYKTSNQNEINFGYSTSNWGTIMGWAIFEIGSDMLLFDDFDASGQVSVVVPSTYYIPANKIVIHFK